MAISLSAENLKRYKDIAGLMMKYGRTDLIKKINVEGFPIDGHEAAETRPGVDPQEFAADLERLGPTYIKLGQLLSTRPDIVSEPYLQALTRLQDKVAPFPPQEAREIIESELGVRVSKAFSQFQEAPIAAASLSQVHRASTRDGRQVAIKVQRPGIRKTIFEDLEAFAEIATLLEKHTGLGKKYRVYDILDQFRKTLIDELDFEREAGNLKRLAEILVDYPDLVVPLPIDDFTTSRVLTMDYIDGHKISDLNPVVRLDYDRSKLAKALSEAYLDQILIHGFLHADPHPGNILLTTDGKLALIDLGMVTSLTPSRRDQIIKLLLAISDGKPEEAARQMIEIGSVLEGGSSERFITAAADIIQKNENAPVAKIQLGRVVMDLVRAASDNGIQPAPELSMMGKALLSLDQITTLLDPDFNPEHAINDHIEEIMRKRFLQNFTPAGIMSAVMEIYELAQKLPARMNSLFDKLMERRLEFKVHVIDEKALMANMQKIANRITVGLILAALIVGAALMMQIQSNLSFLGYPAIATIMFLLAALLGFYLVIDILLQDRKNK